MGLPIVQSPSAEDSRKQKIPSWPIGYNLCYRGHTILLVGVAVLRLRNFLFLGEMLQGFVFMIQ